VREAPSAARLRPRSAAPLERSDYREPDLFAFRRRGSFLTEGSRAGLSGIGIACLPDICAGRLGFARTPSWCRRPGWTGGAARSGRRAQQSRV